MVILVSFVTMIPNLAIAPTQPAAAQALLCERLAQLEATLLEARGRVLFSMDRELASLRGWMDALQNFDPSHSLQKPEEQTASENAPLSGLLEEAPQTVASNIVPFSVADFTTRSAVLREPVLDPTLEQATVDELNAALAAAFQHVADQ